MVNCLIFNMLLTWTTFEVYFVRLNSLRGLLFVIGAWGLMALVVSNVYTSTRLSFMTVTKLGPVINSLNDLAHSKDTQLVGQANTDIFNRFLVQSRLLIISCWIIINLMKFRITKQMELTKFLAISYDRIQKMQFTILILTNSRRKWWLMGKNLQLFMYANLSVLNPINKL